jgi:hypothetical protein
MCNHLLHLYISSVALFVVLAYHAQIRQIEIGLQAQE